MASDLLSIAAEIILVAGTTFAFLTIMALSARRKAKELDQYKDETGRIASYAILLDYGRLVFFPIGIMVFWVVAFVLLSGAPNAGTPEDRPYAYGLFALVLLLTWPLFLEFVGTFVVVTETGITKRSLFRGVRSLTWAEMDLAGVVKTSFGPSFIFAGGGKTLSIGIWMSGSEQVMQAISRFTSSEKVIRSSDLSEINAFFLGYPDLRGALSRGLHLVTSLCVIFSAVVMLWLWSASTYDGRDILHANLKGWILWFLLSLPYFVALGVLAYAWKRGKTTFFMLACVISAFSIVAPIPLLAIVLLWRDQRKHKSGESRTQEYDGFESSKLFHLRKSRRRASSQFKFFVAAGVAGIALGLIFTLDPDTIVEGWICVAASSVTLTMGFVNFYQMRACDSKILLLTQQEPDGNDFTRRNL